MNELETKHLKNIQEIYMWLRKINGLTDDLRVELAIEVYKAVREEIDKDFQKINDMMVNDHFKSRKDKTPKPTGPIHVEDHMCPACGYEATYKCKFSNMLNWLMNQPLGSQ